MGRRKLELRSAAQWTELPRSRSILSVGVKCHAEPSPLSSPTLGREFSFSCNETGNLAIPLAPLDIAGVFHMFNS